MISLLQPVWVGRIIVRPESPESDEFPPFLYLSFGFEFGHHKPYRHTQKTGPRELPRHFDGTHSPPVEKRARIGLAPGSNIAMPDDSLQ
jgi:hypothetical protein